MAETILLVEDRADVRHALKHLLTLAEYTVYEAENGQDGLGLYQQLKAAGEPLDVIITDRSMPVKSGNEMIREIRATDPDIMIIAITGEDETVMISLLHDGADLVAEKPLYASAFIKDSANRITRYQDLARPSPKITDRFAQFIEAISEVRNADGRPPAPSAPDNKTPGRDGPTPQG